MSEITKELNDGGPAFPCNWRGFQTETGVQFVKDQYPGMSLHDWFAGLAMQGMLAEGTARSFTETATIAYRIADAMITQRRPSA